MDEGNIDKIKKERKQYQKVGFSFSRIVFEDRVLSSIRYYLYENMRLNLLVFLCEIIGRIQGVEEYVK